ncbi:right-handed parallel beta-helix repeat-containing protein [Methanobacterium alcaliphilum]|uniref:right-handed parallel beta-helix repeat-containing protein n=1 Tax=Methanobacterium alcaliphilum TaxID=392018 RepID=UPI00200B036C|nr:right-handed parallel beta-helix repeat-containing protein [Methanobacterium alcaliphilum]MCK9151890.1 right-handed parallel beta-helix repeat-containing protein [Methanobacterium alcaliphilum]
MGTYYNNITLVINKSLNIVSKVKTLIIGSSDSNPIFLINGSKSSGTNISGFNFQSKNGDGIVIQNTSKISVSKNNMTKINGTAIKVNQSSNVNIYSNKINNSKAGLSVNNSKNTNINSNSIKSNENNGATIEKSQNITLSKNQLSSNGKNGVSISNSKEIILDQNSIEDNGQNGVNLKNTSKVRINKNKINKNKMHGIYFDEKVTNTRITTNNITNNKKAGIALDKSGSNTYINGNIINHNLIGINVNSGSYNLTITQNIITNSTCSDDDGASGVGINFGQNYEYSSKFNVNYNAIYGNERREVEIHDTDETVVFGGNWYGHSSQSMCNFCPKLQTRLITMQLVQTGHNTLSIIFYDGNKIASLLPSLTGNFNINGHVYRAISVNGVMTIKLNKDDLKYFNTATAGVSFEKLRITFSESYYDSDEDDKIAGGNKEWTNMNSGDQDNEAGNGGGTGSSGSGSTSSSGDGSSFAGLTSSADTGGSSAGSDGTSGNDQSQNNQAVLLDEVTKNPNLKAILAIIALVIVVMVAYYWKDISKMLKK